MSAYEQATTLSLNGEWKLAHCPVGEGRYDMFRSLPVIPCRVPGAVHEAYVEAGMIPEPLKDRNDVACRWLEDQEFWYSRTFALQQDELLPRMLLRFGGLDTTADVWLNGVCLGHCSNALIAHEFDVSGVVRAGVNELVVRIDQGLHEVLDKPMLEMGHMWNNNEPRRAWMRKPQYVYGWDWTIWLPTCGIWQDVTLLGYAGAYMADLFVHPAEGALAEGRPAEMLLEIDAEVLKPGRYFADWVVFDADGQRVASGACEVAHGHNVITARLASARLWQPRGFGEAHCYEIMVCLTDERQECCHMLRRSTGLRTVAIREEELGGGERGFTFVINGHPIFCKGANVVPADCVLGRVTAEKEQRLVALAAESNMNMLRVWGGGVYATEAFLSACDRQGIMVWHDFMYACGYYPDHDEAYYANITHEAEEAVRRLRRHVSVIGWSGNNEIQEMYVGQQKWMKPFPFYGGRIYTELLPRIVREMHPGAVYRESSPLGDPEDPAGCTVGDQHIWHFTHRPNDPHYLDLWRFTDFPVKFLSEFGVIGAMTRETTEACLSPEHRDPDDPVWLFHTNDSQDHGLLNRFMEVYFGGYRGLSLQQYILRSQVIQAEILRHIYDEFRARKFVCSGLLFWTLGDDMGIHNWSLIDYGSGTAESCRRKPAYFAMKRAMAKVAPVIRGYEVQSFRGMKEWREHWAGHAEPLTVWGVNDTLQDQPARLTWRVMTLCGRVLAAGSAEAVIPANGVRQLAEVAVNGLEFVPEETILHVALATADGEVSENRYFFAPFREMLRPASAPRCAVERVDRQTCRVRLESDEFLWQVHICEPDGVYVSDNDFDLLPGEARTVTVTTSDAAWQPELHWVGEA